MMDENQKRINFKLYSQNHIGAESNESGKTLNDNLYKTKGYST